MAMACGSLPSVGTWAAGGRHLVAQNDVFLWESQSLSGEAVDVLDEGDTVLILQVLPSREIGGSALGLVVPPECNRASGWIALDGVGGEPSPLQASRLEDSWELRARYKVSSPVTLRTGQALSSERIEDLEPGEEVLALQLGLTNIGEDVEKTRLRMMVKTESGDIGWLSPETRFGIPLLLPVNLLSPKVVDLHKRGLSTSGRAARWIRGRAAAAAAAAKGTAVATARSRTLNAEAAVSRTSWRPGDECPWRAGSQCRILEDVQLFASCPSDAERHPPQLSTLPAGELVNILDVEYGWCPSYCPFVHVVLGENSQDSMHGWIRCCSSRGGHDVVDTRDQREFDVVQQKLRNFSSGSGHGFVLGRPVQGSAKDIDGHVALGVGDRFVVGRPVCADATGSSTSSSSEGQCSSSSAGACSSWEPMSFSSAMATTATSSSASSSSSSIAGRDVARQHLGAGSSTVLSL
eukprot:TRINITY_DN25742_c0_g3_i1.p1 TRINITY_DN25742_c0_g3~~TRINITY_DN25742_c0_g3_i1.p1  ORF type:complete len:464 (-),score=87.81 TRINITY_DN25742_c0_g3_i1:60-1451(-)